MEDREEIYYIINEFYLKNLIQAQLRLEALEQGGVDNWSWYEESIKNFLSKTKENFLSDEEDYFTFEEMVEKEFTEILKNKTIFTYIEEY